MGRSGLTAVRSSSQDSASTPTDTTGAGKSPRAHPGRHEVSRCAKIRCTDCSETSQTDQSLPSTSITAMRAICSTRRRSSILSSTEASTTTQSNWPGVKVPERRASRMSMGYTAAAFGCLRSSRLSIAWLESTPA